MHPSPLTISVKTPGDVPPRYVEYAYYAVVVYGVLAVALGLSIPWLAGGVIVVLAAHCVQRTGRRAVLVYKPVVFPVGCALLVVVIQLAVHDESLQNMRPFVVWMATLILVHSLSMRRGFLGRFAGVATLLGVSVLPYVQFLDAGGGVERARLDATLALGTLSNSNDLAAWFGFCAVYFTTRGIESRRTGVRVLSWSAALICLYTVSLTVSRGTLFGFAIAATVASRRLLRRGFIPAICLGVVAWIAYESGAFTSAANMYVSRGMEETGRLIVWPLALERFVNNAMTGVGMSNVAIYEQSVGHEITPHNSFLFVGLSSGVLPLAFFVAYWIAAGWAALRPEVHEPAAPFRLPLLFYALVQSMVGNVPFMSPWMIVALSVARTSGPPRRLYRWKASAPGGYTAPRYESPAGATGGAMRVARPAYKPESAI